MIHSIIALIACHVSCEYRPRLQYRDSLKAPIMTSKRPDLATLLGRTIVLLILAVTIVSFVVAHILAWRWSLKPFLGTMLEPTLLISPMESKDWARLQLDPPIEEHLHLIAIDGQSVKQQADVEAILSERQVGDTVQVTMVVPCG